MSRLFIALILISFCSAAMPALAMPCASVFETRTLTHVGEDPDFAPLAKEWLRLNEQASSSDEAFLRVTYQYLMFVADFLSQREGSKEDLPYVKFLKDLFAAKEKGIDTDRAIETTSNFLNRFMTGRGVDMRRALSLVEAIQNDLVPEMARLQVALEGLERVGEAERVGESTSDRAKLVNPFEKAFEEAHEEEVSQDEVNEAAEVKPSQRGSSDE